MSSSCTMQALSLATTTEEHSPLKRILPEQRQQQSHLALHSQALVFRTFCKSIALPSEDNSFGELKKIGTQVISREERDRQRAEEQKQKEKEQKEKEQREKEKEKEKEKEQSSNKSNDNRYNYNYTWDYETNSPVDPDEVRRLQREHGYNTTTEDNRENRDKSTSSNKSSSKEDRNDDIYWEFDGKIYYSEEEWKAAAEAALDKSTKEIAEEEQWNIEHYAEETLKLVNEARAEEGLPSLTLDPDLVEAAEIRARELSELRSHTRPNGSSWSTIIDEYTSYFFDSFIIFVNTLLGNF